MDTQREYSMAAKRRLHTPESTTNNRGKNRGFTLLELVIVMVIVAIGVALAVPSYQDVLQRRATTSQAEQLSVFLAQAQSEAVKTNQMISVQLSYTDPNNWCIGASEGLAGCNCNTVNACMLNGVEKVISSPNQALFSMADNTADINFDAIFVFDPIRGIMISADLDPDLIHSFRLDSNNTHWSVLVDVAVTGRIRICNPEVSKAVPGYRPC